MSKTLNMYHTEHNSYEEYQIIFGDELQQGEEGSMKFIMIAPKPPRSITLQRGSQNEEMYLPGGLPDFDEELKEFVFHIRNGAIIRIAYRKMESKLPTISSKNEKRIVEILAIKSERHDYDDNIGYHTITSR